MDQSIQMDLSFCPALYEMIITGKTTGIDGDAVATQGLSTVNNLIVLHNLHQELRSAATLEVGFAYGASALVFTQGHKDFGSIPHQQHIALDPFQDHLRFAGVAVVEKAGLSGYMRHVAAFSDRALPELLIAGRRFGMIYVDGSHLFEDVFIDCHYSAQLLEMNGVVVFDDSTDEHVAKVIRFVRRNMRHVLEEVDVSPYRSDGGRSVQYRAAKALGRVQLTAFRKIGGERRPYNARLTPF